MPNESWTLSKTLEVLTYAAEYTVSTHFEHRVEQVTERIIYGLVRALKPKNILEIGTSYGGLACAIQMAIERSELDTKFITSEMVGSLSEMAEGNIRSVCKGIPILIGKIEDEVEKVSLELDMALIDTNHDLDNCKWYLENIVPRVKKGGLVWIHDWSAREIDGNTVYEGGSFPEICHLIDLYDHKQLPFEKLFWTWENEELRRMTVASSFWIKC